MRPGPSDLRGSVGMGARVSVMRGRDVLAVDVPVQDVVFEWTSERVVPGQMTYVAPADWVPTDAISPLNNYGQRSRVVALLDVDGVPAEIELGWFLHTAWEEQDDGRVKITALDLMQTLEENPMTWPSSPPSGATILSELRRLALPLPVVLDSMDDQPIERTVTWGESRTEAIRDLCQARGLEYGVKADGYLHVWERRDGRDPVAHYDARDLGTPGMSGILLSAPRKSRDRQPNTWTGVATGSTSSGSEQRWTATVSSTQPPYEPESYGTVRERVEVSSATSTRHVLKAVETEQRAVSVVTGTRSLEIPADPRLEGGDIISATTESGEVIVGRVHAGSLPVSEAGDKMRVDVEELQW